MRGQRRKQRAQALTEGAGRSASSALTLAMNWSPCCHPSASMTSLGARQLQLQLLAMPEERRGVGVGAGRAERERVGLQALQAPQPSRSAGKHPSGGPPPARRQRAPSVSARAWCSSSASLQGPGTTSQGVTHPSSLVMGTCQPMGWAGRGLMMGVGSGCRRLVTGAPSLHLKPQACASPAQPSPSLHACSLTLSSGSFAARRRASSAGSAPHTMASCVAVPPVMCTQSVSGLYSMRCVMARSAGRRRRGGVRRGGGGKGACGEAQQGPGRAAAAKLAETARRTGTCQQAGTHAWRGSSRRRRGAWAASSARLTRDDGGGVVSSARQRLQDVVDEGCHRGLDGVVLEQHCGTAREAQ